MTGPSQHVDGHVRLALVVRRDTNTNEPSTLDMGEHQ